MNWKWPAACVAFGILCFFLGRWTNQAEADGPITSAGSSPRQAAARNAQGSPGEDPDARGPRRASARKADGPASSREPRVSIPLKAISSILKESQFAYSDFDDINRKMPDALTILGATPGEKEATLAVMDRVRAEILAAEKVHVKVAKADESGITLDRSGMDSSAKAATETAKDGLRESLPADVAEALIGSIDWDRFYFKNSQTTSFRITRNANGSLSATTATGTGSYGMGLRDTEYPDNGTPIVAEAIFDTRWAPFLKGKTLLPVNE